MRGKWHKIDLAHKAHHELRPVPIIADAAIAAEPVADGRLIPLVILDTHARPDIDQLVKAHEHIQPGDVETVWGRPPAKGELDGINLYLDFKRPVKAFVNLEFEFPCLAALVDLILGAQALYLQPGKPGQRLVTTFDSPRIIAEVFSDDAFPPEWERIYRRTMEREARRRGLRRRQARLAAEEYIAHMRELRGIRKARFSKR